MAKKTRLPESADKNGEGASPAPMERFKGLAKQLLGVSRDELRKEQHKYENAKARRIAKRATGSGCRELVAGAVPRRYRKEVKTLTDAQMAASHAEYEAHRRIVWTHVGTMAAFALVPPIALFIAGSALLWVVRGFQKA